MTPPKVEAPTGIASMSPGQLLDVVRLLGDQAKSHGSSFERASGCAHAALDVVVTWLEAHQ